MDLPITLFTAFSNLFLGLSAYLRNPKSITHQLFFILALILATWAIINYFSLHTSDPQITLFWIRMILAIATPMWTVLFLLVLAFPHNRLEINKLLLFAILSYAAITSAVALSPYMFVDITVTGNNIQPIPGPGILLHALLAIASLTASNLILVRKFLRASGREKAQLRFFLFGILSSFSLLILTNFILVNVFQETQFVVLGPFFTLILVGSIAYAIVKHRFLDIRIIIARAVTYTLVLLTLTGFYALALFTLSAYFLPLTYGQGRVLVPTFLALVLAFSFHPLHQILGKVTDRVFFKEHYDSHELLADLTKIMAQTLLLLDLTQKTLQTLLSRMRISEGAFILVKDHAIFAQDKIGFKSKLEFKREEIESLMAQDEFLVFDELEDEQLKKLMRKYELMVVLPLRTKEEKIGLLVLGDKASGDIYSSDDLKVLEMFAQEVTVAIQNAEAYEEIKRFNITLREEIEKATRELREANEKLKDLDKLKDEFLSVASHELRTPMTNIKNYLWMALNKTDVQLSENMQKYLDRAFVSTGRLIHLVTDMLNVSRIERGKIEINPVAMDIAVLARDVVPELLPQAQEKGITLEVVGVSGLPQVMGDGEKIREVLINLIGNAIKFTPKDGKVTVSFKENSEMLETSITDTGMGMKEEDLAKLFQKFSRLDSSYTAIAEGGGTGLGLYICKLLVELHGGKIWATSGGLGKGSTFTFTLPVATKN